MFSVTVEIVRPITSASATYGLVHTNDVTIPSKADLNQQITQAMIMSLLDNTLLGGGDQQRHKSKFRLTSRTCEHLVACSMEKQESHLTQAS